jgi:alpha-tubulin suppressor-like RCC1 family protein
VVRIAGVELRDAISVAGGFGQALALKADGHVVGWGNNMTGRAVGRTTKTWWTASGMVHQGTNLLSDVLAISAGQQSLAVKRNGSVIAWGNDSSGQPLLPPAPLIEAVAIAAGADYNVAITQGGMLVSWGDGAAPPRYLSNVVAVAVAGSKDGHAVALLREGTVLAWALRHPSSCRVSGATNVVALAAGRAHYLGLAADGTVYEWGTYSQLYGGLSGVPAQRIVARQVELGGRPIKDAIAIAAGGRQSIALKRDGTVVAWGADWRRQDKVPVELDVPAGLGGVVAIAAGDGFLLAVTTNNPPLP